jgi:hypothetical protein
VTVWKYNAVDHVMLRHKALLDNVAAGLDPQFVLDIQLGKDEETKMGIPDELTTSYRTNHFRLFPDAEDLLAIEAKAQGTRMSKKRRRC